MKFPFDFLSSRSNDIKMVKIVYRNLSGVSNMVDQGRVTLQNFGLCNLSMAESDVLFCIRLVFILYYSSQIMSRNLIQWSKLQLSVKHEKAIFARSFKSFGNAIILWQSDDSHQSNLSLKIIYQSCTFLWKRCNWTQKLFFKFFFFYYTCFW